MIIKKTEFGTINTSLLGEIKHNSFYSNFNDLLEEEDDVCLMLIDQDYNIVRTEITYIQRNINDRQRSFMNDFNKINKHSDNPIVKKYSRIILEEYSNYEFQKNISWKLSIVLTKKK